MKKIVVVSFAIILLVTMVNPVRTCFANDITKEEAIHHNTFANAKDASAYILHKIFFNSMQFKGESSKWKASLVVSRTFEKTIYKPYIQVTLTPKAVTSSAISYAIISNNAYITGNVMDVNKPIMIKSDNLSPKVGERLILCIQSLNTNIMDLLFLNQVIPDGIKITPKQAVNIFVDKYYSTFGKYPSKNFSYEMEIVYGCDWIVSYEDNDGIGGWASLFINGKTGETDDIKAEE